MDKKRLKELKEEHLTPEDLTVILGVGRSTAYTIFREPDFPSYKVGRFLYTTTADYKEWFASRKVKKEVRPYGQLH